MTGLLQSDCRRGRQSPQPRMQELELRVEPSPDDVVLAEIDRLQGLIESACPLQATGPVSWSSTGSRVLPWPAPGDRQAPGQTR